MVSLARTDPVCVGERSCCCPLGGVLLKWLVAFTRAPTPNSWLLISSRLVGVTAVDAVNVLILKGSRWLRRTGWLVEALMIAELRPLLLVALVLRRLSVAAADSGEPALPFAVTLAVEAVALFVSLFFFLLCLLTLPFDDADDTFCVFLALLDGVLEAAARALSLGTIPRITGAEGVGIEPDVSLGDDARDGP